MRPFQPTDRSSLLTIGSDTAFFGAPIERYLDDRHAFEDCFYAYYTDYEPQHSWIAVLKNSENEEQAAGFLTGCIDSQRQQQVMRQKILPGVVVKWLRGGYHSGSKTWRYTWCILLAALRGEFPTVDEQRYPAHLHINLIPSARGRGLGTALMQAYLEQLRTLRIPGVHLNTTSMNHAAIRLYERCGFRLLDARPTHVWAEIVDEPVENRLYGLNLLA